MIKTENFPYITGVMRTMEAEKDSFGFRDVESEHTDFCRKIKRMLYEPTDEEMQRLEEMLAKVEDGYETQGFIYGFRAAMKLAAESLF